MASRLVGGGRRGNWRRAPERNRNCGVCAATDGIAVPCARVTFNGRAGFMALGRRSRGAVWPLAVAAVLGLAISIFDYFWQDNGIHGTLGVALVIGSTLLMAVASVVIA